MHLAESVSSGKRPYIPGLDTNRNNDQDDICNARVFARVEAVALDAFGAIRLQGSGWQGDHVR